MLSKTIGYVHPRPHWNVEVIFDFRYVIMCMPFLNKQRYAEIKKKLSKSLVTTETKLLKESQTILK